MALPHAAYAGDNACKVNLLARLPVVMEDHRASVPVSVNGKETHFWLDTGAFFNTMPRARAAELGLSLGPLPEGFFVTGIGGDFTPELATIREFKLAEYPLHNIQFIVGGSDGGNGFIGANLLSFADTEYDLAHGTVNIIKPHNCAKVNLAYWAGDRTLAMMPLLPGSDDHDYHVYGEIRINGHKIRAMLDTGATSSILTRSAAQKVGIDLNSPKVVASVKMSGVGTKQRRSWIARTDSIDFNGEEIHNSPIRVVDDDMGSDGTDMLLGMDFFLSHHVFIARSQNVIYLTYNGGPIFSSTTEDEIGHMKTVERNFTGTDKINAPKTADEFAGRGSARMTKGDIDGAIADLSEAIRLAPQRTDLLTMRMRAYQRAGKRDLALKDANAALALKPNDNVLLFHRAWLRLHDGDRTGAMADADAGVAATPKTSLDMMQAVGLYERMGKADRALALIDPMITLHREDSSYPDLLNMRCWNRALANVDLDRALDDCTAAIRKSRGEPGYLDSRTLVHLRRKDYAAAITDADAALALRPDMANTLFLRALAKFKAGQENGGKDDLAAARKLSPEIDTHYSAYGLVAPIPPAGPTARIDPDTDDDDNQ
ncbi:TPR repeat-containing protein [Novosphingobium nitrogenifigens DSM 19370]|uniref:TPR repeat-containing protein n=1 Tax=Novosphingobium nitrogenifigens DSM 19370 TaxID=983920 RepID=F1Z770_9SPHN|nr:TPR repeat-containing protein [Novosphingobium nitrogenifigens DSM 19370]